MEPDDDFDWDTAHPDEVDRRLGVRCDVTWDEADGGTIVVKNTVDCTAVVEHNKHFQSGLWDANDEGGRTFLGFPFVMKKYGGARLTHVVPDLIIHRLRKEGIWQDPVARARWLNDPENRAFCVTGEHI
jgi:hypothetical protein